MNIIRGDRRTSLDSCTINGTLSDVDNTTIKLTVHFFRTEAGVEPVREWLRGLSTPCKKAIGEDIKTVQFGWPIGMPLVEKIEPGIWEVRTRLKDGIARVLFSVDGPHMILLHGFIKKTRRIPLQELNTARSRKRQYQEST